MLFYLTNATLDIVLGATWWVASKTTKGIYYLVFGDSTTSTPLNEKEMLAKLLEETRIQREEIKKLHQDFHQMTAMKK